MYVDLATIHDPAIDTIPPVTWGDQIRDNDEALYGTVSAWTPQVDQGASTNIAMGVDEARYLRAGRTVDAWFDLSVAAAGTSGSGVKVQLPVLQVAHYAFGIIGHGGIYDASASTWYLGMWTINSTIGTLTSIVLVTDGAGGGTGAVGQSPSFALAAGDRIAGQVRYLAV